jgi:fructokinase
MLHQGRLFRQAAFAVRVVDTIGCGDAFLASWLSRLVSGGSPEGALMLACATGALVATRDGANPVIDEAEIRALIGT